MLSRIICGSRKRQGRVPWRFFIIAGWSHQEQRRHWREGYGVVVGRSMRVNNLNRRVG